MPCVLGACFRLFIMFCSFFVFLFWLGVFDSLGKTEHGWLGCIRTKRTLNFITKTPSRVLCCKELNSCLPPWRMLHARCRIHIVLHWARLLRGNVCSLVETDGRKKETGRKFEYLSCWLKIVSGMFWMSEWLEDFIQVRDRITFPSCRLKVLETWIHSPWSKIYLRLAQTWIHI